MRKSLSAAAIAAMLGAGSAVTAGSTFQKVGDVLQVVIPGAAAVCSVRQDDLAPFAGRLAGQIVTTQALKHGLGNRSINRRPNGESKGFPSGHTGAAFYGASYLSRLCLTTPGQRTVAYGLAALVGASRIQSDKHDLTQVAAGALLGVMFDRVDVSWDGNRLGIGWRRDF